MKKKIILSFSLLFVLFLTLVGCGKKVTSSEISDYADNTLNSVLTALSNNDYDTFSSYLSDEMKESYDLSTFQKESSLLITNVGVFKSSEFDTGEKRNGYISIIYDATFSDEPDGVRVSITFKEGDPAHKIYELYLDSHKLTEANKNS